MKLELLIVGMLTIQTVADFTPHFAAFLKKKYGEEVYKKLERHDLGGGSVGSFGGKFSDFDKLRKRPIVFVHGVTLKAAAFLSHREYFLRRGYTLPELYATTYGDAGKTSALDTEIQCAFIKQIRRMITAVYEYVGKQIDVIAWSMGSAVTRKALLGGNCSETNEYLGTPLTHMIDTFTAVGGVNYGMQRCPKKKKACNPINSMKCDSILMKELNSQPKRYEGKNSFAIFSFGDHVIGRMCCGHICGELANAKASIEKPNLNHLTIFYATLPVQYKLMDH